MPSPQRHPFRVCLCVLAPYLHPLKPPRTPDFFAAFPAAPLDGGRHICYHTRSDILLKGAHRAMRSTILAMAIAAALQAAIEKHLDGICARELPSVDDLAAATGDATLVQEAADSVISAAVEELSRRLSLPAAFI